MEGSLGERGPGGRGQRRILKRILLPSAMQQSSQQDSEVES